MFYDKLFLAAIALIVLAIIALVIRWAWSLKAERFNALLAVFVVLVAGLTAAWLFRYDVTAAGGRTASSYVLDRWTGHVYVVDRTGRMRLAAQPEPRQQQVPSWPEVVSSPEFQQLNREQQEMARQQYFQDIVAPQVPPHRLDQAWEQFDADTALPDTPPIGLKGKP